MKLKQKEGWLDGGHAMTKQNDQLVADSELRRLQVANKIH